MELKTQTKRNSTSWKENIKNLNVFLKGLEIEVKESQWGEKEYFLEPRLTFEIDKKEMFEFDLGEFKQFLKEFAKRQKI